MSKENQEIIKVEAAENTAPVVSAAANRLMQEIDVFDPQVMNALMQVSNIMAHSGPAVPEWLRNNPGGCFSVCITAKQHKMDPFGLAKDSFCIEGGTPEYGSKATHAIVEHACGDSFEHEKIGDWSKIEGKVEEKTNAKGKKYYVPGWTKFGPDEDGLACKVWLRSRPDRVLIMTLKQCAVRNSTNWANNPFLQLYYQTCKVYARMYYPGAVLGVYSIDEMPGSVEIAEKPDCVEVESVPATDSKMEALKAEFGVEENQAPAAPALSVRIQEAIAASGAPITLQEVEMYLTNRGCLDGYGIDDIEKYPENWRNALMGDLKNLVNLASEWILNHK